MLKKLKGIRDRGMEKAQEIFEAAMSKMPSILPMKVEPDVWPDGALTVRVYFRVEMQGQDGRQVLPEGSYTLTADPDMLRTGVRTYSVYFFGQESPLTLTEEYWRALVENQRVTVIRVIHS